MRRLLLAITAALLSALYAAPASAASIDPASACATLVKQDFSTVPDAPSIVVSATIKAAGPELPAHCLIEGRIAPTIGYRMWLPIAGWNGKYAQGGCGGKCGFILDDGCQLMLMRGYACLASDMGHTGTMYDDLWAIENVPGEIDYGFRSTHVAAITGKTVTAWFYGRNPRYAYFIGASQGGRQGLVEAQRFPQDFDGIVSGEPRMAKPVNTPLDHASVFAAIRLSGTGKAIVSAAQLRAINAFVVDRCDMDDNLKDGIISDPRHCRFDPVELGCDRISAATCLSPDQIAAVRDVYRGSVDTAGRVIQPGPLPGSERHWIGAYIGEDGGKGRYAPRYANPYRYPYSNSMIDSSNPDLRAYKAKGGKLIAYVGWADETNVPLVTIDYYETVEKLMGGRASTQDFFRLFVIPGEGHIPVGVGAETVDYVTAIENWVERGIAPDRLIGAKLKVHTRFAGPLTYPADLAASNIAFTRPVFPYPVQARYRGKGDPNDAGSFVAVMPKQ